LADQNRSGDIVRGLFHAWPELDLVRAQEVGLADADDPAILEWAATHARIVVTHDRHVAQATRRIVSMQDGRIVDDHRVGDAATEDLRALARSRLGQLLLNGNLAGLAGLGLARDGALTAEGEAIQDVLERVMKTR